VASFDGGNLQLLAYSRLTCLPAYGESEIPISYLTPEGYYEVYHSVVRLSEVHVF